MTTYRDESEGVELQGKGEGRKGVGIKEGAESRG